METQEEMLDRLRGMAMGGDKWDLSDNDRFAIMFALKIFEGKNFVRCPVTAMSCTHSKVMVECVGDVPCHHKQ